MIPVIGSVEDVQFLVRKRGRYRPRQRIIALRAAQKWLTTQLKAGRVDREKAVPVAARLVRALRQEERTHKIRTGETVERPGQERAALNATPAAITLASSKGIDLTRLSGTGKDGKILKQDVLTYGAQSG